MDVYRVIESVPTIVDSFEIDEKTVLVKELMGADKVVAVSVEDDPLSIQIDDYIVVNGTNYYILTAPKVQKVHSSKFRYTIEFLSESYLLYNKLIIDEGVTSFSYSGTAEDFLDLIVFNMQTLDVSWAKGDVSEAAEVKTLQFEDQSCRTALTQVAEAFDLEYSISGKVISLVDELGTTQAVTFQYGRGNGLYTITRRTIDEHFGTIWYGYGGIQNLPADYRSGLGRLTFEDSPLAVNDDLYGHKENVITFEDIFPRFTGTVDTAPNETTITDASIDFDLNNQFIVSGSAEIVFKTGDLGGNAFIITSYDHGTKTVQFAVREEESGYLIPNGIVKASPGDEFTFVGIEMPESYITAAEAELESKVTEHAEKNSLPKVAYDLAINERFVRQQSLTNLILPGDRIRVTDIEINVDENLRIQSVEWPLVNPDAIKAVISEDVVYTLNERMTRDIKENQRRTREVISSSRYARKVAEEIRNYAILTQFEETYVGERVVLSGAFVAGNPSLGDIAGVNGAGTDDDEIRFWAGSDYDNRDSAPFRVQQDGAVFMSSAEIEDGCKVGVFDISGGYIKSTDYSAGGSAGLIMSDDGILSRNSEATGFSVVTGKYVYGSFFGQTSQPGESSPNIFPSPAYAGVVGVVTSEVTSDALDLMRYSKGVYGMFASSFKNIGAEFEAYRIIPYVTYEIKTYQRNIIAIDVCQYLYLPTPDTGMVVQVKNVTDHTLYIQAPSGSAIYDMTGTPVSPPDFVEYSIGAAPKFLYDSINNAWFEMGNS